MECLPGRGGGDEGHGGEDRIGEPDLHPSGQEVSRRQKLIK